MLVKVAIDLALDRLFTYEVPEALQKKLAVGQLLSVPFGRREARGFVLEVEKSGEADSRPLLEKGRSRLLTSGQETASPFKVRPVTSIVDETPFFSPALLELVKKVAVYTASPIEAVLKTALPAAVLKKNVRPRELIFIEPALAPSAVPMTPRLQWVYDQIVRLGGGWMQQLCRELKTTPGTIRQLGQRGLVTIAVRARRRDPLANRRILPTKPLSLNDEQKKALEAICAAERPECAPCRVAGAALRPARKPILLFGVTGSGKTEVYLQAIAAELAAGRGAIVMVPEIALTPQTVGRFASRFGDRVAVLHSALSDGERYDEWLRLKTGEAKIAIGARSAIFAPLENLGLIIIDEEHDGSYDAETAPRYKTVEVALKRASLSGSKVI